MANTKRREKYTDRNGKMLIPINVEGGQYNDSWFTTTKFVALIAIIAGLGFVINKISKGATAEGVIILLVTWFIASSFIVRYIIFEEKPYYKMYKQLIGNEVTTPATFWSVASIKDTEDGGIITYSDGKIAVCIKVDRDTITGKPNDFKEVHYDAISDFYKEIGSRGYSFVQMNIMETAGKDPRLSELTKIIPKSDNKNIRELMRLQVGHIKNLTHIALYESDYVLIYTKDMSKIDNIIEDVTESVFKLLDGAYCRYTVLGSKDIGELEKEEMGVTYFNLTEASMNMFGNKSVMVAKPFDIIGITWKNGEEQQLTKQEVTRLRIVTGDIIKGRVSNKDSAIKNTVYRKPEKDKFGIDLNSLSSISSDKINRPSNRVNNNKHNDNIKNNINIKNSIETNEEQREDTYIDF